MALVNKLIKELKDVNVLCESIHTAEKSQIQYIRAESIKLFQNTFTSYNKLAATSNSTTMEYYEHTELVILLAETAFNTEHYSITRNILDNYLQKIPQKDQYFCRAKLLLGLIVVREASGIYGAECIKYRKIALNSMMEALDVASSPENIQRYSFLIYNVSILCWKVIQPFLRPGRAKNFSGEMQNISSALESIDDSDKDWRIMVLCATSYTLYDEGNSNSASDLLDKACEHAEKMLKVVQDAEAKIVDANQECAKEIEEIIATLRQVEEHEAAVAKRLRIIQQLQEDREAGGGADDPDAVEVPEEEEPLEGLALRGYDQLKLMMEAAQKKQKEFDEQLRCNQEIMNPQLERLFKLYMQRVHVNPGDSKKILGLPAMATDLRMRSLVTLQCLLSGCIADKEHQSSLDGLMQAHFSLPHLTQSHNETLLDIARVAWTLDFPDIGKACFEKAENEQSMSPIIRVKLDLCKAVKSMVDLATDSANSLSSQRLSAKDLEGFIVSRRVGVCKLLERMVNTCVSRLNDVSLLQEVCIVLWNACIPLMQAHLRKHIHSALQNMSVALEEMSSPLLMLRTQIHYELSKCEEQSDFVMKAKNEAEKASLLDYGTVEDVDVQKAIGNIGQDDPPVKQLDTLRYLDVYINPMIEILELRSNLYSTPTEVEDQVILLLQQIKESTSKKYQCDVLIKIALMMFQLLGLQKEEVPAATQQRATGKKAAMNTEETIPEMPLDEVEAVLTLPRSNDGKEFEFEVFTRLTQKRVFIMTSILRHAMQHNQLPIMQKAACYILSFRWNPEDVHMSNFITTQIEIFYLLCDSFVKKLSNMWMPKEQEMLWLREMEEATGSSQAQLQAEGAESAPLPPPDPRTLGLSSKYATDEMNIIKGLVNTALNRGIQLATLIKDDFGVQNGVIYFWNLHIHIFRNKELYSLMGKDTADFLFFIVKLMETYCISAARKDKKDEGDKAPTNFSALQLDEKLRCSILESVALLHESQQNYPSALEVAMKGCASAAGSGTVSDPTGGSLNTSSSMDIYNRRKLVELASTLSSTNGNASKLGDPPKFEHPILNVYACIVQAELPQATKDQIISLASKAVSTLKTEAYTWLKGLDWVNLTKEYFDETVEMQAECWTRLCRLKLGLNDIHGAQECAESCLKLIDTTVPVPVEAEAPASPGNGATEAAATAVPSIPPMKEADKRKLSNRVWRWISVCERYYGIAITMVIEEDGQEKKLQNELGIAAFAHFSLSGQYAVKASNQDLIVDSAVKAWNVCIALISETDPGIRKQLLVFIRQLIDCLLTITTVLPDEDDEDEDEEGHGNSSSATAAEKAQVALVGSLKQQFYLAMIDVYAQEKQWEKASPVVLEAFQYVPSPLQKPLWKWRVIVMSKRGKSVLDAVQKLKESNPALQARIYAILARSAAYPKQQLEAYRKTVEILNESVERVDYLLETCQWMASASLPRSEIETLLHSVLDSLYEIEELELDPDDDMDNDLMSETYSRSSSRNSKSKPGSTGGKRTPGSKGGSKGSRGGGSRGSKTGGSKKGSVGSVVGMEDELKFSCRLTMKYQEHAVRTLVMVAMLETQTDRRIARCLEALYFLDKSRTTWNSVMQDTHKYMSYYKLSPADRESTPYDTFTVVYPADLLSLPLDDPVALLAWLPTPNTPDSALIYDTYAVAKDRHPANVISAKTFESVSLTLHYLLWCANYLHGHGYSKKALMCLAWARFILLFVENVEGSNAALLYIHFRSVVILTETGLTEWVTKLPTTLGVSGVSIDSYMSSFEIKQVPGAVSIGSSSKDANISESLCCFGIASYTQTLSNDLDVYSYTLDTCGQLLILGQMAVCNSLVETLRNATASGVGGGTNNERLRLRISCLVAYLSFVTGKPDTAVSTIIHSKDLMCSSGDASALSKHICLLAKCYVTKNQYDEGKAACLGAIETMKENAEILLNTKMANGTDLSATMSGSTVRAGTSACGTQSVVDVSGSRVAGTMQGSTSSNRLGGNAAPVKLYENSAEAVCALADLYLALINIEVMEIDQLIGRGGKDVRPLLQQISNQFLELVDIVMNVHGPLAPLTAKIYYYYSVTVRLVVDNIHARVSYTVTPIDSYSSWLLGSYEYCITLMEKSLHIYNGLYTNLAYEDKGFSISTLANAGEKDAPAGGANNASAAATTLASAVVNAANGADSEAGGSYTYVPLSLPLANFIAFLQLELCAQYVNVAQLNEEHISIQVMITLGFEKTPEDIYLEQTKQAVAFNKTDFQSPRLFTAIQLSTSAAEMLSRANKPTGAVSTEEDANVFATGRHELYSKLHYASCLLWKLVGGGEFDSSWLTVTVTGDDMSSPGVSASNSEEHLLHADTTSAVARALVKNLEDVVTQALVKYNNYVANSSITAAITMALHVLVECYGCNSAGVSAFWLLHLHSVHAREFLYQQWVSSLDKNSDVSVSVHRLNALANGLQPTNQQLKSGKSTIECGGNVSDDFYMVGPNLNDAFSQQVEVEAAFLSSSSVAWRRLSLDSDVSATLTHPVIAGAAADVDHLKDATANVIMNVQMCPRSKTLYLSVGIPSIKAHDATGGSANTAPGVWHLEKMNMTESSRRTLQTIQRQHAVWMEDTAKFTAVYDDSIIKGMDLEIVNTQTHQSFPFQYSTVSPAGDSITVDKGLLKAQEALEHRYEAIVHDLEMFCSQLFGSASSGTGMMGFLEHHHIDVGKVKPVLAKGKPTTGNSSRGSSRGKARKSAATYEKATMLMFIDTGLQDLPWEGLSFASIFRHRVAREFSVHLLGHRLEVAPAANSSNGKHGAKIGLSSGAVKAIVDPFHDDAGISRDGFTRRPMRKVYETLGADPDAITKKPSSSSGDSRGGKDPISKKWTDLCSNEKIGALTLKDWLNACDISTNKGGATANSLLVYIPGRLSSILNPRELAMYNFETISFMYLNNLGVNDSSYRRQNTADNMKDPTDLSLEDPVSYAALLSLSGVNCVACPLWSVPLHTMERSIRSFWDHYTSRDEKECSILEATAQSGIAGKAKDPHPSPNTDANTSSTRRLKTAELASPSGDHGDAAAGEHGTLSVSPRPDSGSGVSPRRDSNASSTASLPRAPVNEFCNVVKPWLRSSRVVYGLFNHVYEDKHHGAE